MKWGDSKTFKFIRLYRMHPCLWDTSSLDYSARKKRDHALRIILAKMNIPDFTVEACKTKIKNVRSQYCHELKKVRLSVRSGGKVYKPTLAWFDAIDAFLRPVVVQRAHSVHEDRHPLPQKTEPSTDLIEIEFVDYSKRPTEEDAADHGGTLPKAEEVDASDLEPGGDLYEKPELVRVVAPSGATLQNTTTPCGSDAAPGDRGDRELREDDSVRLLTTVLRRLERCVTSGALRPGNEFHAFGQSVAAQLETMRIEDALQLQVEIQQLITTKRISRLGGLLDEGR